MKSELEAQFKLLIRALKLPEPEEEYMFHPDRKWRFDFAYPDQKIAIEIEGGVWTQGRHTRGSGFVKDCEKYNAAAMLGWRILKYHTNSIGDAAGDIQKILEMV
jgi:very-short-patch-repair endonuclease